MWSKKEAEDFRKQAAAAGSVLGLENIKHLMKELSDVQEQLSIIHVAGTNGKGSVCAMLESILRLAGYCTGRYSSPAVFDDRERYQINGIPIEEEEFLELLWELRQACDRLEQKGFPLPTLFEIETAAAFLWFYKRKCRIVILETGLGGALDATNIIRKPLLSVITSVSMDHMAVLGDTLEQIAEEKAGIIKEGCPVVASSQRPEVLAVLKRACAKKNTNLVAVDQEAVSNLHYCQEHLVFDFEAFEGLKLSMLGAYQAENAACAVTVVYRLNGLGFPIGDSIIRQGLETAGWPGRFEIVGRKPLMVIDGAHNRDAAEKLRQTLELGFTNRNIIYIIGVLADKEHERMLACMLPLASSVYTITPENPRALPGEELCRIAGRYHPNASFAPSLKEALKEAKREAGEDGLVLAFGSLSYLGQMKKEMQEEMNHGR